MYLYNILLYFRENISWNIYCTNYYFLYKCKELNRILLYKQIIYTFFNLNIIIN